MHLHRPRPNPDPIREGNAKAPRLHLHRPRPHPDPIREGNARLLGCIYKGPDHIPTQLGRGMQGSSAAFTQALLTSRPN